MRTIYFVWEVTFRLIINPIRLHCFAVCCVTLFLMHSQTRRPTFHWKTFDWMIVLIKAQGEWYVVLPGGVVYLIKARRFVLMKCLFHWLCQQRNWLECEMKSVFHSFRSSHSYSYSKDQVQLLRVELDQLELGLHGIRTSLQCCWNCDNDIVRDKHIFLFRRLDAHNALCVL